MVSWLTIAAVVFALAAEALHARRVRRLGRLAVAGGTRRAWTRTAPLLRIVAAGLIAWGLGVLAFEEAGSLAGGTRTPPIRRLVLALDVSPSMDLADAGPDGRQSRATRARDVARSLLARVDPAALKISVVALWNGAKPVVVDTVDPEVVRNVLDDLPLQHAFAPGKTTLVDAITASGAIARGWPPGCASLVVLSDGDSAPPGAAALPAAYTAALMIGVGEVARGLPIDGHVSRQEEANLRRLATRLGGTYHDGNRRHVPTALLAKLVPRAALVHERGRADLALAALLSGAAIEALLPLALALAGIRRPTLPREATHARAA